MSSYNIPTLSISTLEERELAKISFQTLAKCQDQTLYVRIEGQDSSCVLPGSVVKLLAEVLQAVAEGQSIALLPLQTELNLQHAAEILDVSVSYLSELLDHGEIPYRLQENRRWIQLQNLLEYEKRNLQERKAVLTELVADAQELNMGY